MWTKGSLCCQQRSRVRPSLFYKLQTPSLVPRLSLLRSLGTRLLNSHTFQCTELSLYLIRTTLHILTLIPFPDSRCTQLSAACSTGNFCYAWGEPGMSLPQRYNSNLVFQATPTFAGGRSSEHCTNKIFE